MPYYPKSQIIANLYTNGEEFEYVNSQTLYIGYYWKNSKGQYFTGKSPQDLPNESLKPYIDPINSSFDTSNSPFPVNHADYLLPYDKLKNINSFSVTYLPFYSPNIPTQQDYQNGEFRRYFCKKSNEIIYLEVSKETYDKLVKKDSQILYQLYRPFNLPWQLTGDKEQVFKTNKNIVELTSAQGKLLMLSEYLKMDFTKYYK